LRHFREGSSSQWIGFHGKLQPETHPICHGKNHGFSGRVSLTKTNQNIITESGDDFQSMNGYSAIKFVQYIWANYRISL
jgi:hypothetical protein